jgi:hypothetical protein
MRITHSPFLIDYQPGFAILGDFPKTTMTVNYTVW